MFNIVVVFNFILFYYYYIECGKCIIYFLLILFLEYFLKCVNIVVMEYIYEEILSLCKRLKVFSNVLLDGFYYFNFLLKGYYVFLLLVMFFEDKKI